MSEKEIRTIENVLLLCQSKVNFANQWTKYIYKYISNEGENECEKVIGEGEDDKIEGILTNEAPAKVILSQNIKLDRIVVICSEAVNKKLSENPELKRLQDPDVEEEEKERIRTNIEKMRIQANLSSKEELENLTHFEYYKRVISEFAKTNKIEIPENAFRPVNISNNPEENEIAIAAILAANEALNVKNEEDFFYDEGKEIRLYIDYNGGLRYIASMLLTAANLMEQRDAKIMNILTTNFENKINGYARVENYMGVLQSSRLVSGIKEYVDYGRNKELAEYFKECIDPDVHNILDEMGKLSYDLQMCDTDEIFGGENIEKLKQNLNSYIVKHKGDIENYRKDNEKNSIDSYSILFNYVASDILRGYEPLFKGELLEIIDWCRDKDYLQQAITFYAERMPADVFWDKHIYYPTPEEEKEYLQIQEMQECLKKIDKENKRNKNDISRGKFKEELGNCCKSINGNSEYSISQNTIENIKRKIDEMDDKEFHKVIKYFRQNYLDYDWKYSWSQKYIINSYKNPKKAGKDNDKSGKKDEIYEYGWMDGSLYRTKVAYVGTIIEKNNDKAKIINEIVNERAQSDYIKSDEQSKEKKKELFNILEDYQQVKIQRNLINHAESNKNNTESNGRKHVRWNRDQTFENLKEYVKEIRNFIGQGENSNENVFSNR